MSADEEKDNSPIDEKFSYSENVSEDEQEEPPPAFSLATLGLQRVGTAPPKKTQIAQPIQMLNARGMPARIRKRNRMFFDDELINDDRPLRMSLSPRKVTLKGGMGMAAGSPTKTPTKILKKRKGVVSRYMRSDEKQKSSPLTPNRLKLRGNMSSTPGTSTGNTTIIPADKKIGHRIGLRLRNLLKLPKAHKWVIFEWFYSFVDKPLFDGENDFQVFLSESFPQLRTRQLTRSEWRKIRSLIGKPRRCSQAFFEEERRELERKRQKIRYMQSLKKTGDVKDLNLVRDLPDKIPLQLPVGTKVTARLREPQDGIFSGTVDAFDSLSSTYRVTFDRNGLGTHSIPDFEILSENFHEMLPLQSITKDYRPHLMTLLHGVSSSGNYSGSSPMNNMRNMRTALHMNLNLNKSDPLLGQEIIESPLNNEVLNRENINGYPRKLLETMVRLRRALAIKRSKLQRLSEMNNEAERKSLQMAHNNSNSSSDESQNGPNSNGLSVGGISSEYPIPQLSEEFQRRYASIVISMEKMNRDMQDYLNSVQIYAGQLTRDPQVQAMLAPSYLREKCREAATDAVQRNNQGALQNKSILGLIKNLATVLMVASHLNNDGNSAQVSKVLEGCIEEVRSSLYGVNVETFQKHVQIHLHHIRLGMLASNNANNSIMGGNSIER